MFYFVFSFSVFISFSQTTYRLQERLKKLANHAANIEFFFCFVCFVFFSFNNLNHHIQQLVCVCFFFFSVSSSPYSSSHLSWGLLFTCYNSPSVLHPRVPQGVAISAFPKMFPQVVVVFQVYPKIAIPLNVRVNSWFAVFLFF